VGLEYDLLNSRTKFLYPESRFEAWQYVDTPDTSTPVLVYAGRDGSTMSCLYDERGWETCCDYSDPLTPDITYTYDNSGRQLTTATSAASYVYTYDAAGQLLRKAEERQKGSAHVLWTLCLDLTNSWRCWSVN